MARNMVKEIRKATRCKFDATRPNTRITPNTNILGYPVNRVFGTGVVDRNLLFMNQTWRKEYAKSK